jgi:PKD repeat protein
VTPTPTSVDYAPTAVLAATPASGPPPLSVTADASSSWDNDSTVIASYQFVWGDGLSSAPQASPTATHVYGAYGSYRITVIVVDTAGLSSTAITNVSVRR